MLGETGKAGAGELIRDSDGMWIGGFGRNLGTANSPLTKCWPLGKD